MSDDEYNSDGSGTANNFSEHRSTEYTYSSYPTYDQGKDIEVDRAELERIADALETDMQELLRPALDKVTQIGNRIQPRHLGGSQTAIDLFDVVTSAHQGITQYYGDLQQGYAGVIQKLRLSAQGYSDVEQQNVDNVNQVGRDAGSAPVAGTTNSTANSTTTNTTEWEPS